MPEAVLSPALHRAIQHHQAGQLRLAEALYRDVLAHDPSCIEAWHGLGAIALQAGKYSSAVELIEKAADLAPDHHAIHSNLGEAYRRLGRLDEAVTRFRRALGLQPGFPAALNNLGSALAAQGQPQAAIACYRQALQCQPGSASAHNNLGNVLKEQGQFDAASAAYRQALALQPDFAEAHNNLGNLLREQGRLDAAADQFQRALALEPSYSAAYDNFLYTLLFHPRYDAPGILAAHRQWAERATGPAIRFTPLASHDRTPDRRLRIGYVSPDFCDHVVGRNLLPLFHHHRPSEFALYCYTDLARPDRITDRFRARSVAWRNLAGLSDRQVADLIRQDQIDILVDLTLHMAGSRLLAFAHRPAPVQATFAGYPGTTGLATIDYRLTDPYLDPAGRSDADYAETSLRLPDSFWCFAPMGDEPAVRPLPAETNGFITFGCLNNFCKINPPVLERWARVLRAVNRSRILLLAAAGQHRQHALDTLARAGVASDRVEFYTPRSRLAYLELYHQIDVGLDTLPYNGHSTSLDSYWMGVPVVSLVGQTVVGRAGWSQLSNLGLTELAARSEDEFVRIASTLARDLPLLAALRASLRDRMQRSPLMDAPAFARGIEAAYRALWHRWCAAPALSAVSAG